MHHTAMIRSFVLVSIFCAAVCAGPGNTLGNMPSTVSTVSTLPVGGLPAPIFNTKNSNIGDILARPAHMAGVNGSASYGEPVQSPFRFPWVVHLMSRKDDKGRVFRCDGSLVAPDVVLTAGHCENMSYAYIRASGETSLSGYELHEVLFDEAHPFYLNSFFPEFDARLLRLKTKTRQMPVKLDSGTAFDAIQRQPMMGVVGYDTEPQTHYCESDDMQQDDHLMSSSDIRWGLVVYLESKRCYPEHSHVNLITDPMMCAEKVEVFERYAPSCSGYSGGPLLMHEGNGYKLRPWGNPASDVQVGIMSMGMGCSRFGKPGVYAKVASLHGWIESTIARISS